VSLSIGGAIVQDGDTPEALNGRAETALEIILGQPGGLRVGGLNRSIPPRRWDLTGRARASFRIMLCEEWSDPPT